MKVKVAVPNNLYGLCGRKATLDSRTELLQKLCESGDDRPGLPVPNSTYGLCGRKATLDSQTELLQSSEAV